MPNENPPHIATSNNPPQKEHSPAYNNTQEAWKKLFLGNEIALSMEEFSLAGLSAIAPDGEILVCNPSQLTMLGYDPELGMPPALKGVNVVNLIPEEARDAATSSLKSLIEGDINEINHSFKVINKDREYYVPVQIRASSFESKESEDQMPNTFILAEMHDLRQNIELTAQLNAAQTKYEQILRAVKAGIITYTPVFDLKGTITGWTCNTWNPYMEELTGIPAKEAIGKTQDVESLGVKGINEYLIRAYYYGITIETQDVPLTTKAGEKKFYDDIYYPLKDDNENIDGVMVSILDTTERKRLDRELQKNNKDLLEGYEKTIMAFATMLEFREQETGRHSQDVAEISEKFAQYIIPNLNERDLRIIHWGALLHDIGKMGIPDPVLLKKGPLSPEEWDVMKMHTVWAEQVLSKIPFLQELVSQNGSLIDIPIHHHERWDGKGYPHGLNGEDIPFIARMFSIVDGYSALRQNRPYHLAYTKEETIEILKNEAGTKYDPKLVPEFINMLNEGLIDEDKGSI